MVPASPDNNQAKAFKNSLKKHANEEEENVRKEELKKQVQGGIENKENRKSLYRTS